MRIFPIAIDNSMRKELVKCETAAKYRYEMGLRKNEESRVDLVAGKAFAAGMEAMRLAFYKVGVSSQDALQAGVKALYAAYGDFIPPPKSNKTADRMAGALAFYAEQCPLDKERLVPLRLDADTFGVEVSFNYPGPFEGMHHPVTGEQLTFCGRFDMLAYDRHDGGVWVVDEKTTSQMGEKWVNQWPLDSQISGYCWGAQTMLKERGFDAVVKGAIINGIAIRLRDYEHIRLNSYRQQWELDRWYEQMRRDVKRWRDSFVNDNHNQALDHACAMYNNPCEYVPLCQSLNPERIVEGSYIVKRWNPLTREET